MTVQSLPFVPPAPAVHPKNLPVWRLLWNVTRSSISIWPDYAFDVLYIRNSVMGLKTIVVSDPEGVRHVLTANAANYRRPPAVTRFARPLGGSGLFLAEGADWRRQRVSWRRRSRRAALASCCRIFATLVFICCNRLKDRREPISRRPFRTRLWKRSCAPCFPCRRAAIARH